MKRIDYASWGAGLAVTASSLFIAWLAISPSQARNVGSSLHKREEEVKIACDVELQFRLDDNYKVQGYCPTHVKAIPEQTYPKFDKKYCEDLKRKTLSWVKKSNAYESNYSEDWGNTPPCYQAMRDNFAKIDALRSQLNSTDNGNLWRIGSSRVDMWSTMTHVKLCMTCGSHAGYHDCADAREFSKDISCKE